MVVIWGRGVFENELLLRRFEFGLGSSSVAERENVLEFGNEENLLLMIRAFPILSG